MPTANNRNVKTTLTIEVEVNHRLNSKEMGAEMKRHIVEKMWDFGIDSVEVTRMRGEDRDDDAIVIDIGKVVEALFRPKN